MKSKKIFATALLMGTMLMGATSYAKSLVYCSEGSPENFTPAMNTTGTSLDAARPVYNKLVQFEPGTTTVKPALAESYDVSADGTVITFHLRKGVKFHSGVNGFTPTRDLNADDVIWSFDRQWKLITLTQKYQVGHTIISTTWACQIAWFPLPKALMI